MATPSLRIAFLHLAPIPGDLAGNRRLIETATMQAAQAGAAWILTPELAVCGYSFVDRIGTDWIAPQPDEWMTQIGRLAARLRITLFLSVPEQDQRVGSESWSTPGTEAIPVAATPLDKVELLICADAYSPGIADSLRRQGAHMLVSAAAWAPGFHGPNGEWERCTSDTGLPLFVCNRTGPDLTMDFTKAESVVVKDGVRKLSMSATRSTIFLFDWDLLRQDLAAPAYQRIEL